MVFVKKRGWLVLLCVVLIMNVFCGCDGGMFQPEPKNPVVDQKAYEKIVDSRDSFRPEQRPELYINGVKAVYESKKNSFFFSVSEDEQWEVLTPTVEGYKAVYVTAFDKESKPEFLAANRAVKVLLYDKKTYTSVSVTFTSLPLLAVRTMALPAEYQYHDADEEPETRYDKDGEPIPYDPYEEPSQKEDKPIGEYNTFTEITLLDPLAEEHGYENGFTSLARMHIRGRSSREYPKNSFKLELLKEEGGILTERDATLLGMRRDGDWNLNGMYAEPTKVRDKVAADLWLNITADRETAGVRNGYRTEYVEMIVNEHYFGLFLMTERIDRKQMDLADEDYMYFSEADVGKTYLDFRTCEDDDLTVAGYSLKWPKERTEPYDEWKAMEELTLATTWNIDQFREWAPTWINTDSLVDYEVFLQAAAAVDNVIQNTYLIARSNGDGTYTFSFVPWDMDQTFGNRWHGEKPLYTHEDFGSMLEWDADYFWVSAKMSQTNADGYRDKVRERYNELRKTVISDQALTGMLEGEYALLTNSGAYIRNKTRWNDGGYNDIGETVSFVTERLRRLDNQYR